MPEIRRIDKYVFFFKLYIYTFTYLLTILILL